MKILSVNIEESHNGLKPIKMQKLGDVVILAGKNGSGKTRILNLIMNKFNQKMINLSQKKNRIDNKSYYETTLSSFSENHPERQNYIQALKDADEFLKPFKEITTSEELQNCQAINYNASAVIGSPPYQLSQAAVDEKFNSMKSLGINSAIHGAYSSLHTINQREFNVTHQAFKLSDEIKSLAISDFKRLNDLVFKFLEKRIERDIDNNTTLSGFKLGEENLSSGQKILLQICVAIFHQGGDLKNIILYFDEPENHLHPSALIEVLETVRSVLTEGQIWIATHSIPLLAHFGAESIWYVEDNSVSHYGKNSDIVLKGLLGDKEEQERLRDFIDLPAQNALINYSLESLFSPKVVMTDKNDPQVGQIQTRFRKLIEAAGEKKLRILDCGAGKGRLIASLYEREKDQEDSMIDKIDYIAYDPFIEDRETCKANIEGAYGTAELRYFNHIEDIKVEYEKKSFDIILMCNVLHEIDPADWNGLFSNETGYIPYFLKNEGYFMCIEDQQIPYGEKAYANGFLVFNTVALKTLFDVKEIDKGFQADKERDDRLTCHLVPRDCVLRYSSDTRKAAIKSVKDNATEQIIEIRKNPPSHNKGKLHAYWMLQLANTTLSLQQA